MKYLLHLHSTPNLPVAEKHRRLFTALQHCQAPWRIEGPVPVPEFGTEIFAERSFKPYWPPFLKGRVGYRYRRLLEDWSGHDDYLQVEFRPQALDFAYLLRDVLPALVTAFDAYLAYAVNEEAIYADFSRSRGKNLRTDVVRFYPVGFLSAEWCHRALGLPCAEVKDRIAHLVEQVDLRDKGLLYVSRFAPLTMEETNTMDQALADVLRK
jgi:hypothetical protein